MRLATARRLLEESLSKDSCTPNTSQKERSAFLAEERERLRSFAIDPVEVTATPGSMALEHSYLENRVYSLVAVARHKDRWLLCDPNRGDFLLAWSSGAGNAFKLHLLGFRSDDALAEWLG